MVVLTCGPGLAGHLQFDEHTWADRGAYHSLVTYAFASPSGVELLYTAVGAVFFGWLVGRNIGPWRTCLLMLWSSLIAVAFWRFILTPFGDAVLNDLITKFLRYLAETKGLETAGAAWTAYAAMYERLLDLHGPILGGVGTVSGLMMFCLCRRRFDRGSRFLRLFTLLLAGVYFAVGVKWVWPVVLCQPVPYLIFVGGALGGWTFCFPDMALKHFSDSASNVLLQSSPQHQGGAHS
jgi:hypothetical protein